MPAFLATSPASPAFFVQRARPPADDVQRRARARARSRPPSGRWSPASRRGAAAPPAPGARWPPRSPSSRASRSEPVIALNRPAMRADLVVALGEDDARQVALGDGVDALDQPAQRPHHRLAQREPDDQRDADDDQQKQRDDAARGRRHLGVDVAGVAAHAQHRHRLARGMAARQLQPGRVVERHRHRVRARARRRVEQPADRRRPGSRRPASAAARPRRRSCRRSPPAQHLQLEQLVGLARRADAPVQQRR